ncbi:FecR family protein [Pedobacter nyackensis]|uniref:FecR family protein n=1 Tax=Pedobacter nyackensis TaxID=475255 RepID=UPI00292D6F31|nr:FecR domain-containing protein [Pedobacter nyackensis]
MPVNLVRLKQLFHKYIDHSLEKEELIEFLDLITKAENAAFADVELAALWSKYDVSRIVDQEELEERILTRITGLNRIKTNTPFFKRKIGRQLSVAATTIIVTFAAFSIYYFGYKQNVNSISTSTVDVGPGKSGAILTLSNGKKIVLDSLNEGLVSTQNGASIVLKQNEVVYDSSVEAQEEVTYNTITIPRGRQFRLVLADGTKVWLNSASSLKYPTVFTGKKRNVEISGEAYFEVAKNVNMPFNVKINNQTAVEVLGTSFNISAYADEETIYTTLLEGKVRLLQQHIAGENSKREAILAPGEQAQVLAAEIQKGSIKVIQTDVEQVMAWKNGLFNFNEKKLKEVMNQLSRWYDIDVVYEEGVPDIEFWGEMSRSLNLSQVLHLLKKTGVNFKIEKDRKLSVLP